MPGQHIPASEGTVRDGTMRNKKPEKRATDDMECDGLEAVIAGEWEDFVSRSRRHGTKGRPTVLRLEGAGPTSGFIRPGI